MRPLRLLLAATAFVGLTAYTDTANRFSIDFPAEWGEPKTENNIATAMGPGGVNCNATSPDLPAIASLTQDQIDAEMSVKLTAAGWANFLGTGAENVELIEGDVRDVADTHLQIATLRIKEGAFAPIPVMVRIGLLFRPGYAINAGCYAPVEKFEEYKSLFETTVSSLKPV